MPSCCHSNTVPSNEQESQLLLTNRATRLEVSQGHQTIRYVRYGFLLVCYSYLVPKLLTLFEIFDFEKCCDLETTQGHLKWYH